MLTPEEYDPLGDVRDVGFTKIADGIYADPNLRRQARRSKLVRPLKASQGDYVFDGSDSGLSDQFTPSEASRLIRKDARGLKGILRFSRPSSSKKGPSKKSDT